MTHSKSPRNSQNIQFKLTLMTNPQNISPQTEKISKFQQEHQPQQICRNNNLQP